MFENHGFKVESVTVDERGMDVDALELLLLASPASTKPRLVYIIPTHQNPTGAVMDAARRRKLVDLSKKHNLIIIADEVYHLLTYTAESPPPPLMAFEQVDPAKNLAPTVISVGSFTKILSPGLRLGWVHAHPDLVQKFVKYGYVASGGGLNQYSSMVVVKMFEYNEIENNLCRVKGILFERLTTLCDAIQELLVPLGCSFFRPAGGYFVWVKLPSSMDEADVKQRAAAMKVSVQGSRIFSRAGKRGWLRLCVSFVEAAQLRGGVAVLADCVLAVQGGGAASQPASQPAASQPNSS
eukprot:gnl/Hemi2/5018_TR1737_c0_g1_i1.p1 gnl/Hemi2/5018_TR1737_c0_g1~~gnl/Hemi2/5018_TR1737_c0_g1_i1.p1  ORF type:complete len:296 (+),score=72.20 gnl/Hemi2/5018_TR1737_c0_g1_i1:309-1196(+)